jgi:hypothetical protein
MLRGASVFRVVPGPLEILERGRDGEDPRVGRSRNGSLPRIRSRKLAERQVDLHGPRLGSETSNVAHDFVGEILLADQVEVGGGRVSVRDHLFCVKQRAVLEFDASRAAVFHDDTLHGCRLTDRRAGGARGICDALRDRAHSSVNPSPGARPAVDFPDPVVQQHVGRAWAHRSAPCAEDRLRPECALYPLVLEPLVEEVLTGHREQPDDLCDVTGAPVAELCSDGEQSRSIAQ